MVPAPAAIKATLSVRHHILLTNALSTNLILTLIAILSCEKLIWTPKAMLFKWLIFPVTAMMLAHFKNFISHNSNITVSCDWNTDMKHSLPPNFPSLFFHQRRCFSLQISFLKSTDSVLHNSHLLPTFLLHEIFFIHWHASLYIALVKSRTSRFSRRWGLNNRADISTMSVSNACYWMKKCYLISIALIKVSHFPNWTKLQLSKGRIDDRWALVK